MEYKRFDDTLVLRLDPGEEICASLLALASREHIGLAEISGLGAVDALTLAIYDHEARHFNIHEITGPHEIAGLTGTITTCEGAPYLHVHISAANARGQVVGGHLNRGVISVTGEIVVRVIRGTVERRMDPGIGIRVMDF